MNKLSLFNYVYNTNRYKTSKKRGFGMHTWRSKPACNITVSLGKLTTVFLFQGNQVVCTGKCKKKVQKANHIDSFKQFKDPWFKSKLVWNWLGILIDLVTHREQNQKAHAKETKPKQTA